MDESTTRHRPRTRCRGKPPPGTPARRAAALLGVAAMSLFTAHAWSKPSGAGGEKPYRVESYHLDGHGTLDVRTSGGEIVVDGSDTHDVQVAMYVTKHGRNLTPADIDLDGYDIDIHQSGNHVVASARRKPNWLPSVSGLSISFVVHTPHAMTTELNTSGGHIEVQGIRGNQSIGTSGGRLELTALSGTVDAHTSGGDIRIGDFNGRIDARTSGGHIDVDGADGKLTVRTSGGHIRLKQLSGSVDAHTSGGPIDAGFVRIDGDVRLETSGGDIRIEVPEHAALDVDLRGTGVDTHLANFSGDVQRNVVHGRLNGGGPELRARTSGGTVSMAFK